MNICIVFIMTALGLATPRMDQLLECERKLMNTEEYRRLLRVAQAYSQKPFEFDNFRILSQALERYGIKSVVDTNNGAGWGKYGRAIIKIIPDKTQTKKHSLSQNAFRFWMTGQTEFAWAPEWSKGAEACFFSDYVGPHRILLHTNAFLDALHSPLMITPVVAHEAVHMRNAANKDKKRPGIFYGKITGSGIPGYQEMFSLDETPAWIVTLLELLEKPKDPKDMDLLLSSLTVLIRSSLLLESVYQKEFDSFKWVRNKTGVLIENLAIHDKIKLSETFSFYDLGTKEQLSRGMKAALDRRLKFYKELRTFFKQFIREDFVKKQFELKIDQLKTNIPGVEPDYQILYPLLKEKKAELRQLLRSAF